MRGHPKLDNGFPDHALRATGVLRMSPHHHERTRALDFQLEV
jgi:hypothetical protein